MSTSDKARSSRIRNIGFGFMRDPQNFTWYLEWSGAWLSKSKQESPPIGGAVRNATALIPEWLLHIMLAITCCENVHVRPCIYSHVRLELGNNTKIAIYVMRRRRQVVQFSPVFGVKQQKCLTVYDKLQMMRLNHLLQNCKPFLNQLKGYREILTQTWSKMNTFGWFAADRNVKNIDDYVVVNCEVASSSSFQDFPKGSFCDGGESVTTAVAWTRFAANQK